MAGQLNFESSDDVPAGTRPLRLVAVDDDRLLLDGLGRWLQDVPDVDLVATGQTVAEILAEPPGADVVLLDLRLRDASDPVDNVARLVAAGLPVLVVSSHTDREYVVGVASAGAHGYLTKNADMKALLVAVREIAAGRPYYSPELAFSWVNERRPERPKLSDQELRVLLAYAGGATLDAAARRAGIRPGTAREYLDRVREKYRNAGRPASSKIELAERVREDGLRWR